jgi:hypothetical protein
MNSTGLLTFIDTYVFEIACSSIRLCHFSNRGCIFKVFLPFQCESDKIFETLMFFTYALVEGSVFLSIFVRVMLRTVVIGID